jgi:hypothetical protein
MDMRFSHISLIAVVLVVIAVAVAGCSGNSGAQPLVKETKAAGSSSSGSSSSGSSSSGSSGGSGSAVAGTDLFGGLNYNWVEYKMSTNSDAGGMTIYMKFNKQTGKCSMRFEGAGASQMPANMQNIDCSSKGGSTQTQSDPNTVPSDAKVSCSPIPESVTVPAGTFSATKCTVTSQGHTSTTWIVKDKFMVKMESTTDAGAMSMVLNSYG